MAFINTLFLQVSGRFLLQVTNNIINKKLISIARCNNILCNNFYSFSYNKNVLPTPFYFNSLRFYAKGKDKKKEKGTVLNNNLVNFNN